MAEANLTIRLDPELRERLQKAIDENVRLRAEVTDLRQQLAKAAAHPFKGANDTDASMLIEAAKRAEGGYAVGGSNTQATTGRVLRAVAAILGAAEQTEPQPAAPLSDRVKEAINDIADMTAADHRALAAHCARVAGLTVDKEGTEPK